LILAVFFCFYELFMGINICGSGATHTVTHTANKLYPKKRTGEFGPCPQSVDKGMTQGVKGTASVL